MSYHYTPCIFFDKVFDATKDIVVTLDYRAYTTSSIASGGIMVAAIPFYRVAPDGYSGGMGFGYSDDWSLSGLSAAGILDAILGVGLDFTGTFASSGTGTLGLTSVQPNAITVRGSNIDGFPLISTTGNLTAAPHPFTLCDVGSVSATKRVRIRFTDFCSRAIVDAKNVGEVNFNTYVNSYSQTEAPDYVRIYCSFVFTTSTTHVSVQNININAYDATLSYVYSAADYFGLSPFNPMVMEEHQILSAVNVYSSAVSAVSSQLGNLILFTNQDSGVPIVADNYSTSQRYAENRQATRSDSFVFVTYQ